jgi:regulator of RNase E activity RraA
VPAAICALRTDDYRRTASGSRPALAVVEDIDGAAAVGPYCAEIDALVHKGSGRAGVLTNAVMRDFGDPPTGSPVIAASIGPSHALIHVCAIGTPVTVLGLEIADGELAHADRQDAAVIPAPCVPALAEATGKLLGTERIVLDTARQR